MKEISFSEIKPFVRYSRTMYYNKQSFTPNIISAYDCRLFYCTEGKGAMRVCENKYELSAGDLLLFSPGVAYEYLPDDEETLHLLALNFDYTYDFSNLTVPIPPEQINNFKDKNILEKIKFSDAEIFNSVVFMTSMYSIGELLRKLNDEFNRKMNFSYLWCSAMLTDILVQIYKTIMLESLNRNEIISKISEYVALNFTKEISNVDIGKKFGYHPNYLNEIFLKHTGYTLHRYVQDMRITKAIHLLQDTSLPLQEVGRLCGYKDYSHFFKTFKKMTGVSPKKFRQ